jgi:hypothetical protein
MYSAVKSFTIAAPILREVSMPVHLSNKIFLILKQNILSYNHISATGVRTEVMKEGLLYTSEKAS